MNDDIWPLASDIDPWQFVEAVTLEQAPCLLCRIKPKQNRNFVLEADAEAMLQALEQATLMRKLEPFAVWVYNPINGDLLPCDYEQLTPHDNLARETTVRKASLAKWCDERGIRHPWQAENLPLTPPPDAVEAQRYSRELQAAIAAFNAVHDNETALRGKSPRQALIAWLSVNRPELGIKARERIATVANWEPGGGAPKTPAGT